MPRRQAVALAAVLLMTSASPVAADGTGSHLGPVSPQLVSRIGQVRARVADVRAALASADLSTNLRGALSTAGFPLEVRVAPAAIPGWAASAIRELPSELRVPVGGVIAAVGAGSVLVNRAIAESPGAVRDTRTALATLRRGERPRHTPGETADSLRVGAATAAASLLVTEAVDRALPLMRALSQGRSTASLGSPAAGEAAACDVLDQPQVCIGSEGVNQYDTDASVLIDLGGNDTYANNAGGADGLTLQRRDRTLPSRHGPDDGTTARVVGSGCWPELTLYVRM